MHETATSSLREALRDPDDHNAWNEFVERYRPIIVGFVRKLGASAQDAEDVAQETLSAFLVSFRRGDYDPAKGRLRSWLFGIAHNQLLYLRRRNAHLLQMDGESEGTAFFDRIPDEQTVTQLWEREWQQKMVAECLRRLHGQFNASTVQAFELLTLKEWPSEQVAEHLGMSTNAVLKANRRMMSRLRELQEYLEQEW